MLLLLPSLLFLGIIVILIGTLNQWDLKKIQNISFNISLFCFFLSIFLWIFFDRSCSKYQYTLNSFINVNEVYINNNIYFILESTDFFINFFFSSIYFNKVFISFGLDGISLFFILLSTFSIPLCILTSYNKNFNNVVSYCFYFLSLEFFLILSFSATDLIVFFFFFESILIPMFFIIGVWGSRERRIRASFSFFIYTLFGSIFLFFSMLILYYDLGTTSFSILNISNIQYNKQLILWFLIYVAFSVKIPSVPLHIWLPEAHVEAPTAGSVILAGVLLKLGGYGFIRILLPILSDGTFFFLPLIDTFALISIIYASLATIRQIDMKRIIAYSSIAHMNLVVLGIFSGNIQGLAGSIFLMLAHGVVSSALFFLIGVLYDKYGTRLIYYYGGLVQTMPFFSSQLLIMCLANIGLPLTCNFIGELLIFISLVDRNLFVLLISVSGIIFSVLYTIYFCNRIIFGNLNWRYVYIYKDMTKKELFITAPLIFITIHLGLFPDLIFDTILTSTSIVIEQLKI